MQLSGISSIPMSIPTPASYSEALTVIPCPRYTFYRSVMQATISAIPIISHSNICNTFRTTTAICHPQNMGHSEEHIIILYTVRTQIEGKCARRLEFPFSATREENTANSAPVETKEKEYTRHLTRRGNSNILAHFSSIRVLTVL